MDIQEIYALTDSQIIKQIGKRLKEARLAQNIRQTDLAKEANVAVSSVSLLETGHSVSLDTLMRVLRTLNRMELLAPFLEEPQVSPIAIAAAMKNSKQRQRATGENNITEKFDTNKPIEW